MNKKGFTLIELLAVIVILAIIALIATPIVLNIIKQNKNLSELRSVDFYVDAVEQAITREMFEDTNFSPSYCQITQNGNLSCDNKTIEVEVKGETPSGGVIEFEKGKIKDATIITDNSVKEKQDNIFIDLKPGLYDNDNNLIATWEELVKDYGINIEEDYLFENGELVNKSEIPGLILSTNEILKKGTKLVIDDSVSKIGNFAFSDCTSLEKVIIGNGVKIIGNTAFRKCEKLNKIIISNSVESIGNAAFYGCAGLISIIVPDTVTSLGERVFLSCINLTSVKIGNGVTNIRNSTFYDCQSLNKIIMPSGLLIIEDFAFYHCLNLSEIIIPNNVTTIGDSTFSNCKNLQKITIGSSVTSIGPSAFLACESLDKIIIPDSVTNLGYSVFENCTKLKEITLPSLNGILMPKIFKNCINLSIINFRGTQEQWSYISRGPEWRIGAPDNIVINYVESSD